jgi:beta-glucosidase
MTKYLRFCLGAVLAAACSPAVSMAQDVPPDVAKMPFMNPALPTDKRVDDLLGRMTLEEKASQLVNQSRAIPRLGVPAYDWWSEALHGVASGTATVFPEPIGLAASFDPEAIHEMGVVIGVEGRAKYNMAIRAGERKIFEGITFWSPNINIFRDPRWGRGQETYGEDPFLTSRMGVAFVTGLQGDDPKYLRVVSTPKHYAVHSGPEPSRHEIDVTVSKHDEEDTYLPAFRATVVEGKAASVMCVYNSVNGQPGCANDFLLKDTLRGKWGFQGYVVSDCDAVADIQRGHHYVKTLAEAAAVSLKAGTDNDCADFFQIKSPTDNADYVRYIDAVKQGLLTEAEVDVSLRRLLNARFALGMFDPPSMVKYAQTPDSENDSEAHRQLALKIARETMVLLKNDGTLPLKPTVKKILVVGPLADQTRVLEGNYHGTASRYTTALDGIRKQFPGAQVMFEPGTSFLRNPVPVPPQMLSHGSGQAGLEGKYYPSAELSGAPTATRIDPQINFDRHNDSLPNGMTKSFIRWNGYFTPAETATYQIGLSGLSFRMYLDGKLLFEDMGAHPPGNKTVELALEAGHRYPLRVEYVGGNVPAVRLIYANSAADALPRALAAAKDADAIIGVVGITSDLEGEEMKVDVPGFLGGDRTSLDLPRQEEDLMEAMKATGKPLVAVLMNGSALSVNWLAQNANAIVEAWYSGEEGGAAIAETLSGANNPSGKLPVTIYRGVDQLPPFTDYSMKNRTYRYFHGEPLYPFGYGLSYTKFTYSGLKLSANPVHAGDLLEVQVDVTNAGDRDGDDVVELYLVPPQQEGNPLKALRGFKHVHVAKGATEHVQITLQPRELSFVDLAGDRRIAAGAYQLTIGSGGSKADAVARFTISGEQKLPE